MWLKEAGAASILTVHAALEAGLHQWADVEQPVADEEVLELDVEQPAALEAEEVSEPAADMVAASRELQEAGLHQWAIECHEAAATAAPAAVDTKEASA